MNLDEQLEKLEETGETEAELIDQQTELQDVEDNIDEILGEDALESDLEHAYSSFITENEADYNGWDQSEVEEAARDEEIASALNSEGYHIEDRKDLEEEVIEMEIEDGDIYAYLVDEDDNEIGFVLIDENGDEQEYYYVNMDEYEFVEDDGVKADVSETTRVERASDGEEFDLGITREGIAEATEDANVVYMEGVQVAAEFKQTLDEINEGLSFLKKH